MNKKKSRKNKKKRDNNHKSNHKLSNAISNDKYFENFNLSSEQQSTIKFLSEAYNISTQEAHIICNECKWDQSEFPSNFEEVQNMLHWNKKNTKSKIKKKHNKTKDNSPHKNKNSNESKDYKCKDNTSKPGFVPHYKYNAQNSKGKYNKHNNRVLITTSPKNKIISPKQRHCNNNNNSHRIGNNIPNINNKMSHRMENNMKRNEFLNRGFLNRNMTENRENNLRIQRGGYISRGPSVRSRGRGRGYINNQRVINKSYENKRINRTKHITPSPPTSSSNSNPNSNEESNSNYNAIKLPKEYEKDIDPNMAHLFRPPETAKVQPQPQPQPQPPQVVQPQVQMQVHAPQVVVPQVIVPQVQVQPQVQVKVPVVNKIINNESENKELDMELEHGNSVSMPISPKGPNDSKSVSPMKHQSIDQQAFIGEIPKNNNEEYKDQSFMFNHMNNGVYKNAQCKNDNIKNVTDDIEDVNESVESDNDNNNEMDMDECENDNKICDFSDKNANLFKILEGTLVIDNSNNNSNRQPHLCMTFDTLLELANYKNGNVLKKNDLIEWYKTCKNKLIYEEKFFDDYKKRNKNNKINSNSKENNSNNINGNINKTQRQKERKPTKPPISSKTTYAFMGKVPNDTMVDKPSDINSQSVPNQRDNININQATSSRRERVISNKKNKNDKSSNKSSKSNKKSHASNLNLNAKTFEPTKSRSSSRTKSMNGTNNNGNHTNNTTGNNSSSTTPVLSLQNSKSITPQIIHVAQPNQSNQIHNIQINSNTQQTHNTNNNINNINGNISNNINPISPTQPGAPGSNQLNTANINLTNALNHRYQHNIKSATTNAPTPTTQTVTIRNDPPQQRQQPPQPQPPPQTHYNPAQHPTYLIQNAVNASQISLNNSLNALPRVLSHQNSNGSLPGLQPPDQTLQRYVHHQNEINNAQKHQIQQLQQQIRQQQQTTDGLLNNYQQRAVLQAQRQQQIQHTQIPIPNQPATIFAQPPQIYSRKQAPPQHPQPSTQPFMGSPRIQQQFMRKPNTNQPQYITVDNGQILNTHNLQHIQPNVNEYSNTQLLHQQ